MSSVVSMRSGAYARAVFHALRFPASPVAGLLLGRRGGGGDDAAIWVEDVLPVAHTHLLPAVWEAALAQADAYAVRASLSSGRRAAAGGGDVEDTKEEPDEGGARDGDGLRVVGAYFANEHLDSNSELPALAASVAQRVGAVAGGGAPGAAGVALLLDNARVEALETELLLRPVAMDGAAGAFTTAAGAKRWKVALTAPAETAVGAPSRVASDKVQGELLQDVLLLLREHLEAVRDFEEHLDAPQHIAWLPVPGASSPFFPAASASAAAAAAAAPSSASSSSSSS